MNSKDSLTHHFSRQLTAAVQELHLPSEDEFLCGMNSFRNDLDEDNPENAERLSRPIRKRGLRFPEPGWEHLPQLASRILERLYLEQGHDARWATPLGGYEIEALVRPWKGGSIRKVERLVDMLVETGERHGEPP